MIKEKKKKRRRWPIELIRPREEGRMRTRDGNDGGTLYDHVLDRLAPLQIAK